MSEGFILRSWRVSVVGFDSHIYHARSRGMALSRAFSDFRSYRDDVGFKDFLRMARAWAEREPNPRFGEPITVGGKPAFWVDCNRAYIQFVLPGCDVIMNSHPYDVEPPEARRGTAYFKDTPNDPA